MRDVSNMDSDDCDQVVTSAFAAISKVKQLWFVTDPLLLATWSSHRTKSNFEIRTLRCGRGIIEFNPRFILELKLDVLQEVMKLEAIRILLKHPYERRKPNARFAWEASNLAIRECVPLHLPLVTASERFGSDAFSAKHFEYYYDHLIATHLADHASTSSIGINQQVEAATCDTTGSIGSSFKSPAEKSPTEVRSEKELAFNPTNARKRNSSAALATLFDSSLVSVENCEFWDLDAFLVERINDILFDVQASNSWGSIGGTGREQILASLTAKIDFRKVLRSFRMSVQSSERSRTRMRPNRRYGFDYLGSRRDFSTRILCAIDVSGSVGREEVSQAMGIINRFLKYGVQSIDVVWFDTKIRNEAPLSLKKAKKQIEIVGRGGTNFQSVMDYLDDNLQYDGLVVFTDGIAPTPMAPVRNRRTKILWLFQSEKLWCTFRNEFEWPGSKTTFINSA